MSARGLLSYRVATASFLLLPFLTSVDAATRLVPVLVFYPVLAFFAILLGLMILRAISSDQLNARTVFFALMMTVFSLALVIPTSVPSNVLDNQPSMPTTVGLSLLTVSSGSVPPPTSATLSYLDYPGSILTLSQALLVTGMNYVSLAKVMSIFLPLCIPLAFYALLDNKRVALIAATIAGFSPWVFLEGAHYYSASLAGIFFTFALACVFSALADRGQGKLFAVLGALTLALTITDPYFSFMWTVLLLSLLLALVTSRTNRSTVRSLSLLLPISAGVWVTWYFLTLAGFQVTKYLSLAVDRILEPAATPQYLLPSQPKPVWFYGVEYSTFLTLGVLVIVSILLLRRKRSRILPSVESAIVASVVSFAPFLIGFSLLADLAMRSLFMFQIGCALAIGWLLQGWTYPSLRGRRGSTRAGHAIRVLVVLFTVLLILNALTYGIEEYRYDGTSTFANKDTRFNLQSWAGFGQTICSFSGTPAIYGVSLGAIFTRCSWNAVAFANGAGVYALLPSMLTNLTSSTGFNSLVIMRLSMQDVPEWSQPLSATMSATLSRYDVVLTAGDPVLVFT